MNPVEHMKILDKIEATHKEVKAELAKLSSRIDALEVHRDTSKHEFDAASTGLARILDGHMQAVDSRIAQTEQVVEARISRSDKRTAGANENRAWGAAIILLFIVGYFVQSKQIDIEKATLYYAGLVAALAGAVRALEKREERKHSSTFPPPPTTPPPPPGE